MTIPSYPLTCEELERKRAVGEFNPLSSYEDYQAMLQDREEIQREAEEAARRGGFALGAPELDLSPEDEAVLDGVWAQLDAVSEFQSATLQIAPCSCDSGR